MAPSAADGGGAHSVSSTVAPAGGERFGTQTRGWVRRLAFAGIVVVAMVLELVLWGFDPELRTGQRIPRVAVVAAVVGVFVLLLLWRRRRPLAVFGLTWVYSVSFGILLPSFQPFTALSIALYVAARDAVLRRAGWLLAAAVVMVPVNTVDTVRALGEGPAEVAVTAGIWLVIFLLVWTVARAHYGNDRRTEQALAALTARATMAAQTERLRIARELHDVVAHSVTAMILHAAARQRPGADRDALVQTLGMIEQTGTQAMGELRTLLGVLHSGEDAPGAAPGLDDLDGLVSSTRACGVEVRISRAGRPRRLAPAADQATYRIVQELLTNVAKHGGDRARASLTVLWHDDQLDLSVENSIGRRSLGRAAIPSGFGLDGIRSRVDELGGRFTASRPSDRTFCCRVLLPAERSADERAEPHRGREAECAR